MRSTFASVLISLVIMNIGGVGVSQAYESDSQGPSSLCQSPGFPRWSYDESNLFPQDRPLGRPEDGKALPDGRMIVGDERHGLLLINKDGSHRPFGQFQEAGYVH